MLAGDRGEAAHLALRLLIEVGEMEGAPHLIDIESSHIDGCLYHGRAGLDFANRLVDGGARVAVPTTLNVSSLDLLHPDLFKGDPGTAALARELMEAYLAMGCQPTWTCAPYQLPGRPPPGTQIAWGESNAIVFANSVMAARTNRYGDFMDICCALTGRAPFTGLHTNAGRLATTIVEVRLPESALDEELTYALIGHVLGRLVGTAVPVLVGLDHRATEDRLKALGAAAASSGSVAMFHAVGVTPEAASLEMATGESAVTEHLIIDAENLSRARRDLSSPTGSLGAVSVGTPHMSSAELADLAARVRGRRTRVPFYVNTARQTLENAERDDVANSLIDFGATIVTDTCTYITPIMGLVIGDLMTNSAKLAYYAPANLGVNVCLGSLADCVESAVAGHLVTGR
jgi:predicted aconitase